MDSEEGVSLEAAGSRGGKEMVGGERDRGTRRRRLRGKYLVD